METINLFLNIFLVGRTELNGIYQLNGISTIREVNFGFEPWNVGSRQTTRVAGGGVGRDGMGQPLRGKWEQLTELTAKLADQRTKVNFHPPYHQLDICIVFMVGLDGMDGYSTQH